MNFPVEFSECPQCGCKETLYQDACKDELSKPKNMFAYLDKKITPIQDFLTLSTPTTRVLVRHYDTCSHCGFDFCVRAEKLPMPTNLLMQMMGVAVQMAGKK